MGGGRNSDEVAAWPTAEISFMDPKFAVTIVSGLEPGSEEYRARLQEMERDSTVWDIASMYALQHDIRPEETREYLIRVLDTHRLRLTKVSVNT